jgi:hypothetical protein
MAGVYEVPYQGKSIVCLDVAGLKLADKDEFKRLVNQAKELISQHPPKSVLLMSLFANTGFDTETAAVMGDYADHNTPYVKASALVGISGVQKVVLAAIRALTGREFYIADTVEEAQEWLVKQ